tara:strand:+ start:645 stop:1823 length:1179 start_codon:yes stop_codon:yes gene_type:complete
MENIIEPSDNFDFSKLNLENPVPLQGGNFFTKLNFSEKQLPILVQLPKCSSKHGLVKTQSSKKLYIDLLFNYFETDVLTWFENLETKCRELIFSKKDIWFQSEMDLDDIENMFISPTKSYKSGKFLTVRAHIPSTKHIKKDYCLIYDENERNLETSAINENVTIIPLITIEGIRFSSKSFQLEINLRQVMVLKIEDEIKKGCLIKRNPEPLDKNDENKEDQIENLEKNLDNSSLSEHLEKNDFLKVSKLEDEKNEEEISNNKTLSIEAENTDSNDQLDISSKNLSKTNNSKEEPVGKEKLLTSDNLKDQKNNDLLEVDLSIDDINDINDPVSLKKPSDVYMEIYKTAREKAKHMKQATLEAYLEARNIKTKYMLNEINPSDDESLNSLDFEE